MIDWVNCTWNTIHQSNEMVYEMKCLLCANQLKLGLLWKYFKWNYDNSNLTTLKIVKRTFWILMQFKNNLILCIIFYFTLLFFSRCNLTNTKIIHHFFLFHSVNRMNNIKITKHNFHYSKCWVIRLSFFNVHKVNINYTHFNYIFIQ